MKLQVEAQVVDVADETRARFAMVRPILVGVLHALAGERVERLGGENKITLADLAREYREGSGDCGICFEYAVHDAIRRQDNAIYPIVSHALEDFCKIPGGAKSILFGIEKAGRLTLIETASTTLTDESLLLYGKRGRPVVPTSDRQPFHGRVCGKRSDGLWVLSAAQGCN